MKFCLTLLSLISFFPAWSLNSTHFTITRISAPYFIVDANSPATITKSYVGFEVTNNASSGVTYMGLKFTINSIGTSVTGQNYSLVSPASGVVNIGTLAPGQSKICYFYTSYPASVTVQATFNTTLNDNTAGTKTQSFTISNRSSISANAGGTATQTFTNQDLIGGLITDDVVYAVSNVQTGDESDFQVAVSSQFDPTRVTLLSTQVVASSVPGINLGATDSLYFITGSGSNGATITIRWTFRIAGYNYTNYLLPCAGATSGNTNYKYALNTSIGSGAPVTVSAGANPLTISKISDRSSYLFSSPAVFTITIQNPGAYGITLDRITDELPSGFTYQSLDASSQVTGSNSTTFPVSGATGTLTFEGGVTISGNTSYYIPAGGSIILKYTATSPASSLSNQVTNVRDFVGVTQVGTAQNSVSVVANLPISLVSFLGSNTDQGIILKWTSSNEVNTKVFELERSNGSGEFRKIGMVAAAGNTPVNTTYSFTDHLPLTGANNYRLRMIDQDLSFTYSRIVSLKKADQRSGRMKLYPNPFSDHTALYLSLDNDTPVSVMLFDAAGKLLLLEKYAGRKGDNTFQLNWFSAFKNGNYIIQVKMEKSSQQYKMVKL